MSLRLLCRRRIAVQRAITAAGPTGEVLRQWQSLAANLPATILAVRVQRGDRSGALAMSPDRRDLTVTHVILVSTSIDARFGDRVFDGTDYYQVCFLSNLGDRDQSWAIYAQRISDATAA